MQTDARVVVIGGGVVGCSVLFHLARYGWNEVLLLERSELTSGSSWHAAGMFHTISADPNLSSLQSYTIELYDELEALSGQSIGLHRTGQIYLASTPERVDYLKQERSKARYLGLPQEFISLEEAVEMNPLIDPDKYLAALFDPVDGHIDPSGVVHAYARAAKKFASRWPRPPRRWAARCSKTTSCWRRSTTSWSSPRRWPAASTRTTSSCPRSSSSL